MKLDDLKTCSDCRKYKNRSEFNKDKQKPDGLSYYCRKCSKKHKKKEYRKNIDTYKKYNKTHIEERKNYMDSWREKYPWKNIWSGIQQRCENPKASGYKYYGGKGIKCLITEGEFIKTWTSSKEIEKFYNIKQTSISVCVVGKTKSCNGFKWRKCND